MRVGIFGLSRNRISLLYVIHVGPIDLVAGTLAKSYAYLRAYGRNVQGFYPWSRRLTDFDMIHHFGPAYGSCEWFRTIKALGKRLVVTPIYWIPERKVPGRLVHRAPQRKPRRRSSHCLRPALVRFAGLLKGSAGPITLGSFPMHLGVVIRTPLVALFGATSSRQWRPYPNGQNNLVVEPRPKFPETRRRCGGFRSITSSKRSNASSRNVMPESGGVPRRGACKTPAGLISSDRSESTDLDFSTKV